MLAPLPTVRSTGVRPSRRLLHDASAPASALLVLACCLPAGCGLGTAGIAAAADDGSSDGNAAPTVSIESISSTEINPVHIRVEMVDAESNPATIAQLSFRQVVDGAPTGPSVEIGPSYLYDDEALTVPFSFGPLDTAPGLGVEHELHWDFAAQLADQPDLFPGTLPTDFHGPLQLSITLVGGGQDAETFPGIGNDPPVVSEVLPPACGTCELAGSIAIAFRVFDSSEHDVDVTAEYDLAGDADGWLPATAVVALQSLPTTDVGPGLQYIFVWNSDAPADLGDQEGLVQFRVRADDGFGGGGVPSVPVLISVDNNAAPSGTLVNEQVVTNADRRRGIPIPVTLDDPEQDEVGFLLQWTREGQPYAALPGLGEPGGIAELLEIALDPVERRARRLCTEIPREFGGLVASLPDGVDPALAPRLTRLPELAGTQAGLLAREVAGRTIEILRHAERLETARWQGQPLSGPVAAVPLGDGLSALVLDRDGAGWRVREIALADGSVVPGAPWTGSGTPTAFAHDAGSGFAYVASLEPGTWTIVRRDLASSRPDVVVLGPARDATGLRALAVAGRERVLATSGDELLEIRFGPPSPLVGTIVDGLAQPWGIAVDPSAPDLAYVAEASADRVLRVDLRARLIDPVAAQPADGVPGLALPSPRSLALERAGARLLVLTEPTPGTGALRALDLRSPFDYDVPADGADPEVFEIAGSLATGLGAVSTGADGLRIVALPATDELALAGGVLQSRSLVDEPASPAYDPTTQVVTAGSAFSPALVPSLRWRVREPIGAVAPADLGRPLSFVWDSGDVPGGGRVTLRLIPFDSDIGTVSQGFASKVVAAGLDVPPTALGLPPQAANANASASGDLDADGDLDLVTTTLNGDSHVVVWLQTSPGAYASSVLGPTSTNAGAVSIALADLDSDGRLDLAVANRFVPDPGDGQAGSLTVFLQEPTPGTFPQTPLTLPQGNVDNPRVVKAADLDGDGRADLVSANEDGDNLTVFYQAPGGTWLVGPEIGGLAQPNSVDVADFDGDGRLDLVAADTDANRLAVFLQEASGGFAAPILLGGTSQTCRPLSVVAADVDGDGHPDVASANECSDNVVVYFQEPEGTGWSVGTIVGQSELDLPVWISTGDFDADGDVDLATAQALQGSDDYALFHQTSPREFDPAPLRLLAGDNANPQSLACADLDGDGDLDLVGSNFGAVGAGPGLSIFWQSGRGEFGFDRETLTGTGSRPIAIAAADLDGDGRTDLTSADQFEGTLSLFIQTSPAAFDLAPTTEPVPTPTFVVPADLDGDRRLDLVVSSFSDRLLLFPGLAGGGFGPPVSIGSGLITNPFEVSVADLDGDGDLDLVSANFASQDLRVFLQDPTKGFPDAASFSLVHPEADSPSAVTVADLDGNGQVEIIATGEGSRNVFLFTRSGTGFVPVPGALDIPPSTLPTGIAIGDIDGDGRLDLAISCFGSPGSIAVFFQDGPLDFARTPLLLGAVGDGPSPRSIALGDLDQDEDLDCVSADHDSDALSLYFQVRPRVFRPRAALLAGPPGARASAAGLSDVDGDGEIDIAWSAENADSLRVEYGGH